VQQLITVLMAEYEKDRQQQWMKKTTLLNLLITTCIGNYTYQLGASDLLIDQSFLLQYIEQLVIPELQGQ